MTALQAAVERLTAQSDSQADGSIFSGDAGWHFRAAKADVRLVLSRLAALERVEQAAEHILKMARISDGGSIGVPASSKAWPDAFSDFVDGLADLDDAVLAARAATDATAGETDAGRHPGSVSERHSSEARAARQGHVGGSNPPASSPATDATEGK